MAQVWITHAGWHTYTCIDTDAGCYKGHLCLNHIHMWKPVSFSIFILTTMIWCK